MEERLNGLSGPVARTVTYNYSLYQAGFDRYSALTSVDYFGDATLTANYTYQNSNASGFSQPLLRTCDDSMYGGAMKKIAYKFKPGGDYGQILSENYFNGARIGQAVSTLTASEGNPVRTETRGDGATRTFTYSSTGLLSNWTDFLGKGLSQGHDANGYVNSFTDQNGHTTQFTRDPLTGNVLVTTYPLTAGDGATPETSIVTYGSSSCPDPNNRDANNPYYVCSMTDTAGNVTTYTRDTSKRVKQANFPDGGYETFLYNPYGQVRSHRLRTGGTESFTYKSNGLKDTYRNPDNPTGNPTARYQYDNLDRVAGITDALGGSPGDPNHATNFSYNLRGQLRVTTLPVDPVDGQRHTRQNDYNRDGTLASKTDELGHVTTYNYDDYKRLRRMTPPRRTGGTPYWRSFWPRLHQRCS